MKIVRFAKGAFLTGTLCAVLILAGCVAQVPRFGPVCATSPDNYLQRSRELFQLEGERNAVLNEMRLGTVALGMGRTDESATAFDGATNRILAIYADTEDARRAKKLWNEEAVKSFKGEPYERAMALFFRGILYLDSGEADNARACFRSAQMMDALAEENQDRCDFISMDWLESLSDFCLGEKDMATDCLARVRAVRAGATAPTTDTNVLLVGLIGKGPRKIATGQYGEMLQMVPEPSPVNAVRVSVDGAPCDARWLIDSVSYQAATRGGRPVDYILDRKAHFKAAGEATATVAEVAGAGVMAHGIHEDDKDETATGAAVLAGGVLLDVVSSQIRPKADTRVWDTLPDAVALSSLRLTPGAHSVTFEFLTPMGAVDSRFTQTVHIDVPSAPGSLRVAMAWSHPPQYRYIPIAAPTGNNSAGPVSEY
jgi:hypothetical protein